MNKDVIQKIYSELENDNLCFIYQGSFTNKIITTATNLIKRGVVDGEGFDKLRNRLSFLMVESFQNIVRYGEDKVPQNEQEEDLIKEIFITRNLGNCYYIISGNLIKNENVEFVRSKLEQINQLGIDELKELYLVELTNRRFTPKGGAGLGFIEMARKTKQKLDYEFTKIDDDHSFFFLQIKLTGKNKDPEVEDNQISVNQSKLLKTVLIGQQIIMLYKGNFSNDAIGPVLTLVNNNLRNLEMRMQKIIFHLMVEILQNISKHAYKKDEKREGLFTISKQKNHFYIGTGNLIENSKIEILTKKLTDLNRLSKEEKDDSYRKTLIDGAKVSLTNDSAGLGLIDIARESPEPLEFDFVKINEQISFFTLKVKL